MGRFRPRLGEQPLSRKKTKRRNLISTNRPLVPKADGLPTSAEVDALLADLQRLLGKPRVRVKALTRRVA